MGNSSSGRSFRIPWRPCNNGPGPGPFSPPSLALGENKGRDCREPSERLSPGLLGLLHTRAFSQGVLTRWFPFLVSSFLSRPNYQALPHVKNFPQLFQAEAAWNHPAKLTVTSSTKDGLIHLILPQRRRAQNWSVSDAQIKRVGHAECSLLHRLAWRMLTDALLDAGHIPALSLWPIWLKLECSSGQKELNSKVNEQRKLWFPSVPFTTGKPLHLGEGIGLMGARAD